MALTQKSVKCHFGLDSGEGLCQLGSITERDTVMKRVETWVSFDGQSFSDERECRRYEQMNFIGKFVNLSLAQVEDAATREDKELANAFESFGLLIRKSRYASGDLKRLRRRDESGDPDPSGDA